MKIKNANKITPMHTSHGCGEKFVLASADETISNITQIAETVLYKGETAEMHAHDTMEEFFYILDGEIEFLSNDGSILCGKGDFIHIMPKELHGLHAVTESRVLTIGCATQEK